LELISRKLPARDGQGGKSHYFISYYHFPQENVETALVVEGLSLSLSGGTLPLWAVFSLIMTGHYQHWDENMIYGCH